MPEPLTIDSPLSTVQYYQLMRGQIEHEDNLITQRISWFLANQSFLFTAYAIVVTNVGNGGKYLHSMLSLLWVIPILSIVSATMILMTIIAGFLAMYEIRKHFTPHSTQASQYNLPPIHGLTSTRLMGMAAPLLLPIAFILVWLYLIIRQS